MICLFFSALEWFVFGEGWMIKPLVLDSKRKEEGVSPSSSRLRLYPCFLAHPVSFPFRVSPQHPLASSLVSRGNSVEISWFGPKISKSGKLPANSPTRSAPISNKSRVLSLVTYIPGKYPATAWVFCRFSSILPPILPQTSSQTQEDKLPSPNHCEST